MKEKLRKLKNLTSPSSTPERIKKIRVEKRKILLSLNKRTALISLSMVLLFLLINLNKSELVFYSFIFYAAAIVMLLLSLKKTNLYKSYYYTWESVEKLLLTNRTDEQEYDLYLENFQINYNKLRKRLKYYLQSSSANFSTHNYEISRIIQDIDTFFDVTIKILFRKKIMTIPFCHEDEQDMFIEAVERQVELDYERWKSTKEDVIDFNTINEFLKYFGNIVIRKPRTKVINLIAIGELFRKWNIIIEKFDNETYKQSKKDVEYYYDKRQDRTDFLIKIGFEILIVFTITITTGLLLNIFI